MRLARFGFKPGISLLGAIMTAFALLSCAPKLPFRSPTATPTPTPSPTPPALVVAFEAVIIVPTPTATPTPTQTPTSEPTPIPLPSATHTPLPAVVLLPTHTPTAEPPGSTSPIQTPTAELTATLMATPATPVLVISSGPGNGSITLVELPDQIALPADVGRVEFKWLWQGKGCEKPPAGYGFEIRIWPERPGFIPLGIMDAAKQDDIKCEADSGTRSYEVGNLRSAPGVKVVDGGRFRWEIALVQLEPYTLVDVSPSRTFDLPSGPPQPTPTPTPLRVVLPTTGQVGGVISLVELQNNLTLPADAQRVEFRWRWSLSPDCKLPPLGYGFELRIWPEGPAFAPLGAMGEASASQKDILCEPNAGLFIYQVPDIKKIPALFDASYGRFSWDVTLIQFEPYTVTVRSEVRVFELPKKE